MKYTLYEVRNTKSKIRGYWLDKGKLYKDNITLVKYKNLRKLEKAVITLFKARQLAIFYKGDLWGYCIDKTGKLTVYHNRTVLKRTRLSIQEIKKLLSQYGGLTIYNCKATRGLYFIEVYSQSQKVKNTKVG